MARLEAAGLLDRAVAGLPDEAALRARAAAGEGLTRPELAALLPFAKLWLLDAIGEGALPDDPALHPLLMAYFPQALRTGFAPQIGRHRLRRELVATILANLAANRLGPAAIGRLAAEAGGEAIARAAWLAAEAFGIEDAACRADAAPAAPAMRLRALLGLRRVQEGVARALLATPGPLQAALDTLRPGVAALAEGQAARPSPEASSLAADGIPHDVAVLAMGGSRLAAAPAILRLAAEAGVLPAQAAAAWDAAGTGFGLDALRAAVEAARVPGPLGARARAEALADLAAVQARLARARLSGATRRPRRARRRRCGCRGRRRRRATCFPPGGSPGARRAALNKAFAWAAYDWANSAFPTVVSTFVIAAYFAQGVAPDR
jgi:glutamate dehydrogenase